MIPALEPAQEPAPSRGFSVPLFIGAAVVIALLGAVWFLASSRGGQAVAEPLPFGPGEQEYAKRIRFHDFKLSRAENLLGHEITLIECTIENSGSGIVREIEVELEFYDLDNQLVLQETRRLLGRYAAPMGGGRYRKVDLNFETIPAGWNQHPPQVRITGLVFEP